MGVRSDTIFALSSAAGRAGVAVIRLSGPNAFAAAQALCGKLPNLREAALRSIRDPETHEILDRGLVLCFAAPASFTGEDVVELHLHGSLAVVRAVQKVLARKGGCRFAEPGEFTRRAWLNGKLDLLEIESLSDTLAAETEAQRRFALDGARLLRSAANRWREALLDLRASVEAAIDFSDEGDVVERLDSASEQLIRHLMDEIGRYASGFMTGARIRQGFSVAILGPPNAGKSSLINALAKREVAITSPQPGTTRDIIEVALDVSGFPVRVFDTAGIRTTDDHVEAEGVRRAISAGQSADMTIWLTPADAPEPSPDARFVTVISKADLRIPEPSAWPGAVASVSILQDGGIDTVIEMIRGHVALGLAEENQILAVSTERQNAKLVTSLEALEAFLACHESKVELRSEELRRCSLALDELIGRIEHEEILGQIFSRFCIGK